MCTHVLCASINSLYEALQFVEKLPSSPLSLLLCRLACAFALFVLEQQERKCHEQRRVERHAQQRQIEAATAAGRAAVVVQVQRVAGEAEHKLQNLHGGDVVLPPDAHAVVAEIEEVVHQHVHSGVGHHAKDAQRESRVEPRPRLEHHNDVVIDLQLRMRQRTILQPEEDGVEQFNVCS